MDESAEYAGSFGYLQCDRMARRLRYPCAMKDRLNALTEQVIGAAIAVHRALGPGLLEAPYAACLGYELVARGLSVERHKPVPLQYQELIIECAYQLDFLVNDEVIVELKSVERLTPVHDAQLICYLRLMKKRVGLLINFNVNVLAKEGIRRKVNDFQDSPKEK